MSRLIINVCENYLPEFQSLTETESFDNVEIVAFKNFCDGGVSIKEGPDSIGLPQNQDSDSVLVCSHLCRASRSFEQSKFYSKTYESIFCYSHMISDHFARFFSDEGYYVITTGWLTNWEKNIDRQGFKQDTAREFYKKFFSKLVFLDTGIYSDAEKKLKDFSIYLDIPAISIPVSLDPIRTLLKAIVSDWRIRESKSENYDETRSLRELNAQNSAVLNIMSKIAGAKFKRDVISMLDQIWIILFGASKSYFWSYTESWADVPQRVKNLKFTDNRIYILDRESQTFFALLESGGEKYGIIEVGSFLFPESTEKYVEMFNSIIKIAALAISNAQRYEELVISKNNFEYSSHHDGLTGVFNRTYFNKIVDEASDSKPDAVYSMDLDGLKEVNDTLGHAEGDTLIKEAAEALRRTFRESDSIFRMGGDEFTVLVNDCDEHLAEDLLNRLQDNIRKINLTNHLKLSLSTGFCVAAGSDDDIERMVNEADLNMYKEKRKRKDKHVSDSSSCTD